MRDPGRNVAPGAADTASCLVSPVPAIGSTGATDGAPSFLNKSHFTQSGLLQSHAAQVVESELQRVPANVARRYSSQLWSMVYIPQVRARISGRSSHVCPT
jgi:hypothetical protein